MKHLNAFSRMLERGELFIACVLAAMITVLILLNIFTRAIGQAIYWVDEAAIASMVWMGLLGASISVALRSTIAVTLIPDVVGPRAREILMIVVDVFVLVFAAILAVLVFNWFDPLALMRAGFEIKVFTGATFNFIYSETTTTLGIPKYLLWLVMPVFSFCLLVHALNNIAGSLSGRDSAEAAGPESSVV